MIYTPHKVGKVEATIFIAVLNEFITFQFFIGVETFYYNLFTTNNIYSMGTNVNEGHTPGIIKQ